MEKKAIALRLTVEQLRLTREALFSLYQRSDEDRKRELAIIDTLVGRLLDVHDCHCPDCRDPDPEVKS